VREKNPSKTLVSMKELKLGITVPLCSAAKSQDIEKEAATVTVSAVVVRLWLGRRDDTKKVCLSHCYMYSPDEDMCNGACLCFGSAGECAPTRWGHGGVPIPTTSKKLIALCLLCGINQAAPCEMEHRFAFYSFVRLYLVLTKKANLPDDVPVFAALGWQDRHLLQP
jgi:hypothetical protein